MAPGPSPALLAYRLLTAARGRFCVRLGPFFPGSAPRFAPVTLSRRLSPVILGIGLDLVDVSRVERELARRGGSLFDDLFTPAERARCRQLRRPAEGYAIGFAAKEAYYKAISTGKVGSMAWRDIEVAWTAGHAPTLTLGGATLDEAVRRGVTATHLAVSRTRTRAMAVVVACGRAPALPP